MREAMDATRRLLKFSSIRSYFLISVFLISGTLIASGFFEIYYRYSENLGQIGHLQREVALGAAFKIEQFVQEIERTMRGSHQEPGDRPQWAYAGIQVRVAEASLDRASRHRGGCGGPRRDPARAGLPAADDPARGPARSQRHPGLPAGQGGQVLFRPGLLRPGLRALHDPRGSHRALRR